ncbi:MAG TPA: nucleotidyltransferase domain-containing protein [Armatimonadota bacterium]|nr:nucleotidyltransferase domain-containing protein [Armatimonadota bacterium]
MSGYDADERRGRRWMQPTPDRLVDAVRAMAEAEPRIDAVYLFGSHATGTVRATSDVDLAVLLDPSRGLEDHLRIQFLLEEAAEDRLGLPVDVIVLRWDLSPSLLFEIFGKETILFARDRNRAHRVACRARAEYRHELPRLERARKNLLRRLEGWADAVGRATVRTTEAAGEIRQQA